MVLTPVPNDSSPHEIYDSKGRKNPELLSDRELLIELVRGHRAMRDLVETFVADMAKNPIMSMMASKLGKKSAKN